MRYLRWHIRGFAPPPGGTVRRLAISVAALSVAAGAVIGCSGSPASTSTGAATSETSVTIGVAAPISEQALPFYALSKGFFKQYGIDATVKLVSATEGPSLLASGRIQFMSMSSPTPELVHLSGAPVDWLAMWATKPDMQLVADSGITSVADLRGKNVAITADGSTTQTLTDQMLTSAGIPTSAVHLDPVGAVAQEQAAFISGAVSAYLVAPPGTSIALQDRKGAHIVLQLGSSISWIWAGLAAYMPYANSHGAATENVLKALLAAIKSWEHDPSGAEATISKVGGTTNPSILKAAYADSLTVLSADPVPSPSVEKFVLSTLASTKPGAATASPSSFMDDSYIDSALK